MSPFVWPFFSGQQPGNENEEKNETLIRARDYLESTKSSSLKISKAQNTTRDEMTAIIFCLMITNPELFHSGNMWNFIKILPSRFKRAGFQMLIVYFKKFLKEKTEYAHDMQTLADRIGFDDEFSALLQINHCSLMTA